MLRLPKGVRRLFDPEDTTAPPEETVGAELDFHLEMRARELVRQGLTPEESRREAQRLFGDAARIGDELVREARHSRPRARVLSWVHDLRRDLGIALRMLAGSPSYTVVAIVTLGLGIGANTAVFTLVDGVLMSPLPYRDAEQLVTLWSTTPSRGLLTRSPVSYPDFRDWKSQSTSFQGMAVLYGHGTVLGQSEGPVPLVVAAVSGDYFEVLEARAVLGSTFTQAETTLNQQVVVLKYGTWQRRFGGDPAVIGRTITLDGIGYTVVGVTDRGRDYPPWGEMWIPLTPDLIRKQNLDHRGQRIDTWVLARLRAGIDSAAAATELQTVAQRLALAYPETNTDWSALVAPLRQIVIDPFGRNATLPRSLLLLNGAVALVLLIACANVANLSFARVVHRRREFAVRTALGAGRWRLIRQLLSESLLLSAAGAALGVIFARWAITFMLARGPALPRDAEIGVDVRVLGFTAALVALTTLLFGLVPAFRSAAARFTDLRAGARGSLGPSGGKSVQSLLVVSQVGVALLLLIGAGLLVESLRNLQGVDPGFDSDNLLVLRVQAPAPPYSTDAQLIDLHQRLEQAAEAVPGVIGAATVNHVPGGGMVLSPLETPGLDTAISVAFRTTSPDYIETMGIPVLQGRSLYRQDMAPWSGAMLVNQRLAGLLAEPLGTRVTVYKQKPGSDFGEVQQGVIVGVVGDLRGSLAQQVSPYTVYLPYTQNPWQSATLVVRTDPAVQNPARLVREALLELDPTIPLVGLRTMEAQLRSSLAQQRFAVLLLGSFAGAALFLAALGIYGVLAYLVRQRARELSVRMALGARRLDVVRLVVRRAMMMVGVGGLVGLVAAVALTRVMGSLLFGVSAIDPTTFIGVLLVLGLVALAASYLPARRAASLDPMQLLREE
jgi:putative ABC transport system permease protein